MLRSTIALIEAAAFAAAAIFTTLACTAEPARVGAVAPSFRLVDQNGKAHTLRTLRGHTVVIAFYPADMSPGCTLEARSFRDTMTEFARRNVTVFGISVQDVRSKRIFCDQERLNYTLLADAGGKTARAYGVLAPTGVAKRVTFLVDKRGRIAKVIDSVDVTRHGAQVIEALDALQSLAQPETWAAVIGQIVPPFQLPDVSTGESTEVGPAPSISATVIAFVCAGCPISNAYEDRLRKLAEIYRGNGVRFIGIDSNVNEITAVAAAHFARTKIGFSVLRDEGALIADRFGAEVTPQVYVIDRAGILRYSGRVDDNANAGSAKQHDLRDAIVAVLAGETPRVPSARAFGCTIVRTKR